MLDFERLPLLPELGAGSRVAELAGMAIDCSGSVDFSQSPFHLGKLEAHLFGLTVGEGSDGALVDRSRGGETEVGCRLGDVEVEHLQSVFVCNGACSTLVDTHSMSG